MSDTIRTRRVAELIKHELYLIISREINDPRVHDVVITDVRITKDLSIAHVYFSSYDKESLKEIEIGLEKSKNFIRKKLFSSVHLKKIPQIIFERDNLPDGAQKLDTLLKQIENEHIDDGV